MLGPALAEKVHKVARIKIDKVDARFSRRTARPEMDIARRPVLKLNIDPEDVKRIKDRSSEKR